MVEGARLESVCGGNSTVGSNPTLSAEAVARAVKLATAHKVQGGCAIGARKPRILREGLVGINQILSQPQTRVLFSCKDGAGRYHCT